MLRKLNRKELSLERGRASSGKGRRRQRRSDFPEPPRGDTDHDNVLHARVHVFVCVCKLMRHKPVAKGQPR